MTLPIELGEALKAEAFRQFERLGYAFKPLEAVTRNDLKSPWLYVRGVGFSNGPSGSHPLAAEYAYALVQAESLIRQFEAENPASDFVTWVFKTALACPAKDILDLLVETHPTAFYSGASQITGAPPLCGDRSLFSEVELDALEQYLGILTLDEFYG